MTASAELVAALIGVAVTTTAIVGSAVTSRYRLRLARAERRADRRRSEASQLRRERELLLDLVHLHSETEAPRALLRKVTDRLACELELDRLAVYLIDGGRLVLRAYYGTSGPVPPPGHEVALAEGLLGEVAASRKPVFRNRLEANPRRSSADALPDYLEIAGWRGLVPIVREKKVLGLVVAATERPGPLAIEPNAFLVALGAQVGFSVCQDRLIHQLRELSTHDELTGLANRRLLTSRLQAEAFRGERFGHTSSVIAIDIDHFKQLNDRHGHKTGDAALVAVARLMTASVRRVDLVARIGGEEFVVVLPRTEAANAALVAEKLRSMIAGAQIPGGSGQPHGHLTVSLGVASFGPDFDTDVLLADADRAMYRAKQNGRNRVEIATPGSVQSDEIAGRGAA
jgi:diguanylate cyclase (GGDEF)-like protein